MEKKHQKIYIWSFIIISGVLLLLMYTPLGGDLHRSTYGPQEYRGSATVNFGSKINNAPKAHSTGRATQSSVPLVNQNSNYSALSSPVVGSSNQSSHMSGSGSYHSNQTTSSSNNGAGSGGGSMMALGSRGGGGTGSGATGGGSFSGGGLFNSSAPGSNSTMQKSGGLLGGDLADPGGVGEGEEEDLGNPLPVGDGLYLMLFMALLYWFIKFIKL